MSLRNKQETLLFEPWMQNDLHLRRVGYLIALVMLVGVGGWAVLAPLEVAALAEGRVQVQGKRKPVQHLEGGIVSQILVANGDRVLKDEVLLTLDATKDRAEKKIIEGRLLNQLAQFERLKAERDGASEIAFSEELIGWSERSASAVEAMRNEEALFNARSLDRAGEADLIQAQITQLQRQRDGIQLVIAAKAEVEKSIADEIEDLRILLESGFVDNLRLRQMVRQRSQLLGEISDLTAKSAAMAVSIEEYGLRVKQLEKRFKTSVVSDLTEARERLFDLRRQFDTVEDRVDRAFIKAPVAGAVLNLKPNTVGAVIGSGETVLELVPNANQMMVEAKVSPLDIDRVSIGQSAEVRFSVFKDAYLVTAEVVKLSPDSIVDENDSRGARYYLAELMLDQSDIFLLEGLQLVPGMPAEVLIKTGERTMIGYLTSPLRRLISRGMIEE